MTRQQAVRLILSLALLGAPLTSNAVSPFQISGVVVNILDGSPIPHAHLSSTPASSGQLPGRMGFGGIRPSRAIEADADDSGRFVVTLPSAGRWRLVASAIGYVAQAYDAHEEFSSSVVLTEADPKFALRFQLSPEAEITGTVVDEAGEAVREARVMLEHRGAASSGYEKEFRNKAVTQTDDRGLYDFTGLAPGDYRVKVDAKPWYSTSSQLRMGTPDQTQEQNLDVTYPLTWFPGANDPMGAEVLSLKAADMRRADFQLTPIRAGHVTFAAPEMAGPGSPGLPSFPVVERVDAGGAGMVSAIPNRGADGRMDLGGLTPGVYRVRMAGPNQERETRLIEVRAGDSRVIDASSAAANVANITIEDGGQVGLGPAGLELIDTAKGTKFTSFAQDVFFRAGSGRVSDGKRESPVTMQVPPGRYEVRLRDRQAYLLGISASGADVAGRFVTVHEGAATLRLRTATGRASVHGIASEEGKPVQGAIVLLIPAGLDDQGNFTAIVRDQTNTDGSFDLNDVVPGQYILVAVANGWQISWNDLATLQHYLTQGVPLELRPNARVNQDITAQQP
ncbi:MAG TPA: carboxypeptidase-like regulatory domain-containing protein [Edaphobacter sp.]|nr:carboxypeptidase-like regulatory domain-containing protein [Edaphobacter sp.]